MNKNKFNLIVFDWDGTLYDSTAVIINSIQRASADLGYRIPGSDLAASVIGLGFNESMKKIFPNLDKVFYESGLSVCNYSSTIEGWATLTTGESDIPAGLTLNNDIDYASSVQSYVDSLSTTYLWTISDTVDSSVSCN